MTKRKSPAEEAEDLRQVVVQAHEAIKDLTRLTRESKSLLAQIQTAAHDAVEKDLGEAIKEGLDSFLEVIKKAIAEAESRVNHRFDTVASIMLGEDYESVRRGDPSLEDYARRIVEKRAPRGS